MAKKLPGVFQGKVKKNSGNNKQVFYSNKEVEEEKPKFKDLKPKKNINQKLNEIFDSSSYIYKADVEIKLENDTVIKQIVGRNKTHLITMDNELIPISNIKDIKLKQD